MMLAVGAGVAALLLVVGTVAVADSYYTAQWQDREELLNAAHADAVDEAAAEARKEAEDATEQEMEEFVESYTDRIAELDAREDDLNQRSAALDERESAIQATEEQIDASKIAPGTYLVPEELAPGRYRTMNNVSGTCYMAQKNGEDIIDNMLEREGRPVFTVQDVPRTTFTIDGSCGTVQKID